MLHVLLYAAIAVGVAGVLFFLATRLLPAGEQIAPAVRDEPLWSLPADQWLDGDDVDAVKLPVALRGYRFAETDQLLDRLAGELRWRDEEIARLRAGVPPLPDDREGMSMLDDRAGAPLPGDRTGAPMPDDELG